MMPGGKILLMCCNGLLVMTGAYQAGGLAAGVLEQRIIEQEAAPLILPAVATETNKKSQVRITQNLRQFLIAISLRRNAGHPRHLLHPHQKLKKL